MLYGVAMETTRIVAQDWPDVLRLMPVDLDRSASEHSAIERRREISSGGDLLRLALAYAVCDYSLRETGAWAERIGMASMSDVAVMKRLKGAAPWLGHLVFEWLRTVEGLTCSVPRVPVRVLDATVICEPGSKGTDWRLHMGIDLAEERISTIELTGAEGGETFARHHIPAGCLALGDRGYAQRQGVASVLKGQGHVLVRLPSQSFPLETTEGAPLGLLERLETLNGQRIGDWAVQFRHDGVCYPVRLIALRKTRAAAEQEQKRLRAEAKRKGRKPSDGSMRAAHFVAVITDLPPEVLPANEALELYRLRWQIEMFFKRLKGLLHLDHLRAKDPALAAAYLYAKILGALILDHMCNQAIAFSPWGFPLTAAPPRQAPPREKGAPPQQVETGEDDAGATA